MCVCVCVDVAEEDCVTHLYPNTYSLVPDGITCYATYETKLTWLDAASTCYLQGGRMALVPTEGSAEVIALRPGDIPDCVWVGLNRNWFYWVIYLRAYIICDSNMKTYRFKAFLWWCSSLQCLSPSRRLWFHRCLFVCLSGRIMQQLLNRFSQSSGERWHLRQRKKTYYILVVVRITLRQD